jgi:hypothetical protein
MSIRVDRWWLIVPALFTATALAPLAARAQEGQLRIQADIEYVLSDIETENRASGETIASDFSFLRQKYFIVADKQVFPFLSFRGGGFFEFIDSETKGDLPTSGLKQRNNRLFGEMNLTNPLYTAGLAYRHRVFETTPRNLATTRITRDEYAGLWRWKPVGLPSLDIDFQRFDTRDDDETRDTTVDLLFIKSRYNYEDFHADYTYTRNDRTENLDGTGDLTQVHNGGLRYSTYVIPGRLELTGAARLNYDALEPKGVEDLGEVQLPTSSPGAPFFNLNDSDPDSITAVDAENPLSTVNIGQGAPPTAVAVGLEFESPTEVDTIYVFPVENAGNPALASPGEIAAVAGSFTWRVFLSDDQRSWNEQPGVFDTYDVFENRFEISFSPDEDALFIKVVTTPVTSATGEIRIARLSAFETVDAGDELKLETFTQLYNFGARWAVSDRTRVTYDGLIRIRENQPIDRTKRTLLNSVAIEHEFSPMFYGDVRVLRNDATETDLDDTTRHTYNASLTGDYLPTLSQTLTYNGYYDQLGDQTGYGNALLLRTNADPYRDWSLNLDLGFNAKTPVVGPETTSTFFRLATNLTPHPTLNFTLDYFGSWDTDALRGASFNQIFRFRGFWTPIPTLSLFAAINLRNFERDIQGLRIYQNYSINWAPFPDGLLNFTVGYNQTIDTNNNESRIFSPAIRYQVTRSTLLTLSFDFGTIESQTDVRDVQVLRVNFRTYY